MQNIEIYICFVLVLFNNDLCFGGSYTIKGTFSPDDGVYGKKFLICYSKSKFHNFFYSLHSFWNRIYFIYGTQISR